MALSRQQARSFSNVCVNVGVCAFVSICRMFTAMAALVLVLVCGCMYEYLYACESTCTKFEGC